jgi:hypothetical protein
MLISLFICVRESFSEDVYIHGTKEQSINERYNMMILNIKHPEIQKGTKGTHHGTKPQNLTK